MKLIPTICLFLLMHTCLAAENALVEVGGKFSLLNDMFKSVNVHPEKLYRDTFAPPDIESLGYRAKEGLFLIVVYNKKSEDIKRMYFETIKGGKDGRIHIEVSSFSISNKKDLEFKVIIEQPTAGIETMPTEQKK